jgi:hypothetical protein
MNILEIILPLGLGAAGLFLAHSVRRQLQVKVADARVHAYTALWEAMKLAAPDRAKPMSAAERCVLYGTMTDWYFNGGHGMLMPNGTGRLFEAATRNLVRCFHEVVPACERERLAALPAQKREAAQGRLSMRQLALLRTRMKADLAVYGRVYDQDLRPEDEAFLRDCGENLHRRPWRQPLLNRVRLPTLPLGKSRR